MNDLETELKKALSNAESRPRILPKGFPKKMIKMLICFLCLCSITHLCITGCNKSIQYAKGEPHHFDANVATCVFIPPLNENLRIRLTKAKCGTIVRLANKTYSAGAERVEAPMPATDGMFLIDTQRFFWIGDALYRERADGRNWLRVRDPVLLKVWKPYSEAMLRKPLETFTLEEWQGFLERLNSE